MRVLGFRVVRQLGCRRGGWEENIQVASRDQLYNLCSARFHAETAYNPEIPKLDPRP